MRWHLVSPTGSIVRSADAASLAEARFRLGGIPPKHFIASAVDYANGYHKAVTPPVIRRVGRGDWYANATTDEEREAIHQKLRHAAVAGLLRWQMENPEKEQARRDKIAAYQRQRAENRRLDAMRQANIQRGIEHRKRKANGV